MRASVNTLTLEVQRLQKKCQERREAEEALCEKWKRIEEFDARRMELESIYTALLRANMVLQTLSSLSWLLTGLLLGTVPNVAKLCFSVYPLL